MQAWWVPSHRQRPLHPQTPLRDWPCTHKPECFPHPWPVRPATGAKTWSPTPGTQPSPPGSILAWGRAGRGLGSTPLLTRGWGHCSMLCPSAQAVGSGSPRHLDLPPPSVLVPGATPRCLGLGWSPRKLLHPHPCPAGSPRQFCGAVWAGQGHDGPVPEDARKEPSPVPAVIRRRSLCRPRGRFLRRCLHAMGTAADTPANDEFLLLRSLESPHVQRWTPLTHDLDFTALLHTTTRPGASSGRYAARSQTPRPPLPTLLRGGVTTDGFSLIRGCGVTRALLGIILGNPASRHGLNTSRASQNKVIRESWVTQAVTQGLCY